MKIISLLIAIPVLFAWQVSAQTINSFPAGTPTIKYDLKTKKIEGQIPIDHPFIFNIVGVNGKKIKFVEVYKIKIVKGKRKLDGGIPSMIFNPSDLVAEDESISITFPAFRGNRDFDILLTRPISDDIRTKILDLNKNLYQMPGAATTNAQLAGIDSLDQKVKKIYSLINDIKPNVESRPFTTLDTITDFNTKIYGAVRPFYNIILNSLPVSVYTRESYLTQSEITAIANAIDKTSPVYKRLYVIQKIINDSNFDSISYGYYPVDYKYPLNDTKTDEFDFSARIKNLKTSIDYLDSLHNEVSFIQSTDTTVFSPIEKKVKLLLTASIANKKSISTHFGKINEVIDKVYPEQGIWVTATNTDDDLKAKGGRIFALDAGIMTLGAFNNNNHFDFVPKIFLGLNIFFKPFDKNISSKYSIKRVSTKSETHSLESSRSIWNKLCLTAGFTLGAMKNKDFDNLTNGVAVTLGPSYSILNAARVSAGVSFLRRNTTNPLASDTKVIMGGYLSISADLDLLEPIKKLTSIFF